jgi:hypothetical protein
MLPGRFSTGRSDSVDARLTPSTLNATFHKQRRPITMKRYRRVTKSTYLLSISWLLTKHLRQTRLRDPEKSVFIGRHPSLSPFFHALLRVIFDRQASRHSARGRMRARIRGRRTDGNEPPPRGACDRGRAERHVRDPPGDQRMPGPARPRSLAGAAASSIRGHSGATLCALITFFIPTMNTLHPKAWLCLPSRFSGHGSLPPPCARGAVRAPACARDPRQEITYGRPRAP